MSTTAAAVFTTSYDESIPGYPKFRLHHGTGKASAEVFLNGATVASWTVLGRDNLFMRSHAVILTVQQAASTLGGVADGLMPPL